MSSYYIKNMVLPLLGGATYGLFIVWLLAVLSGNM